jgi:hypothetical protein
MDYNMNRPHSSLGCLTPNEYADRWHQRQEPNPNSHSDWTNNRGPVTSVRSVPSFNIRSPSRNFRTICSGVCRFLFIVKSSLPSMLDVGPSRKVDHYPGCPSGVVGDR